MDLLWFLVVVSSCLNCSGIDPGIILGFQAHYDKIYVAMPSRETCMELQKINFGSECWAKVRADSETSGTFTIVPDVKWR